MRDAQVRRLLLVNDMGHLVGAISIEDLVLVAQNARAGDDGASVVGFHAGCVERRGRGLGSLSRFRDGVDPGDAGGDGSAAGAFVLADAAEVDTSDPQPPLYQALAPEAAEMSQCGVIVAAIARHLRVDPGTVNKGLRWLRSR